MQNRNKTWIICAMLFIIAIVFWYNFSNINMKDSFDNHIDIKYYVISMKDNEKRMKNIESQQKKLSSKINIFDAINGDNIDMNNIPDQKVADKFKENTRHRKREIGCFLSHYGVLKKIKSEGNPDGYTVVLEDDFNIIVDNFEEKLKSTLESMKSYNFDMLYIESISNSIGDKMIDGICKMDMNKDMWGIQAYIVKNANIDRFLENTQTIDMPIDWKYINAIKSNKLTAYTFCPYLTKSTDLETTLS